MRLERLAWTDDGWRCERDGNACGEICPHEKSRLSEMHNQTMTITAISEVA
jgi:hypothetical protein